MTNPTLDINGRAFWAHNGGNPRALRRGDFGLQFEVRPGDRWPDAPANERSEVCTQEKFRALDVEFDMRVLQGQPNTAPWCVIGQFRQKESPSVALELKKESLIFVVRDKGEYGEVGPRLPVVRDRWYWVRLIITETRLNIIIDRKTVVDETFVGWPGLVGEWKNGIYRAAAIETLCTQVRDLTVKRI